MKSEESKWLEKAKETRFYHRRKLNENTRWTILQTARSLRRSSGSICEDLLICKWLTDYSKELEKFDYRFEALDWIRKKKRELDLHE